MNKRYKIPVILYESEGQTLPYIEVEKDDDMPPVLFIQEYKHTGECEPGMDGSEQPIVDITVHMYADMNFLSNKLSPKLYDKVRVAMGLKPLKEARKEGKKILDRVYQNVNKNVEEALSRKESVKEEALTKLNERLTDKFFKSETANNQKDGQQNTDGNKLNLQFEIVDEQKEEE